VNSQGQFIRYIGVRSIAAAAVLLALGAGAYWCLRAGYAGLLYDRGDPVSVLRARELARGKAEYFTRAIRGEKPSPLWHAVRMNPYYARGWIELGLEAELAGDTAEAERLLLKANRVDRTYVPRWSMANFCFRRKDKDAFWAWARRALEMAPHDQSALFDLCWRMSSDAGEILGRAIPRDARILSQYTRFLLRRNNLDAAGSAAEVLAEEGGVVERASVLACCDRLLEAGRTAEAERLWNRLSGRRLIPYPPLSPAEGRLLTNGNFSEIPLEAGFDWRIPRPPGVSIRGPDPREGLSLVFSGKQPEGCDVLVQAVPVIGGASYGLGLSYRTEGIEMETGLHWRIAAMPGVSGWAAASTDLASEDWSETSFRFTAPAGVNAARIALRYQRRPGTTRIEGTLRIRRVWMEREETRAPGLKKRAGTDLEVSKSGPRH